MTNATTTTAAAPKKTLEERILDAKRYVAKLEAEKASIDLINNVSTGDQVKFKYGRAEKARVLQGVVAATKETDQGLQLRIVVDQGGFDEQSYKVSARDITEKPDQGRRQAGSRRRFGPVDRRIRVTARPGAASLMRGGTLAHTNSRTHMRRLLNATSALLAAAVNFYCAVNKAVERHEEAQVNALGSKVQEHDRLTDAIVSNIGSGSQVFSCNNSPDFRIPPVTGQTRYVNWFGKSIGEIYLGFKRLVTLAGLDERISPYSLRHTMAKELRGRGVPWKRLKASSGTVSPARRRNMRSSIRSI